MSSQSKLTATAACRGADFGHILSTFLELELHSWSWTCDKRFGQTSTIWRIGDGLTEGLPLGPHLQILIINKSRWQSTNTQIHKYTSTQILKYTSTQVRKYTAEKGWFFVWQKLTNLFCRRQTHIFSWEITVKTVFLENKGKGCKKNEKKEKLFDWKSFWWKWGWV